jgi:HTH-type transcriptional regulator/antitoxin HipB
MRLNSPQDLGRYLRDRRRSAGLSQTEVATRAGLSRRWLSDLEAGKPTVEIGLVLKLIASLGLMLDVRPEPEPELDLDEYLKRFDGAA